MTIPTHIAGTFLIHADASFLNGAGLGQGENRNVTVPKTLRDMGDHVPYVSSQAWKRWLRNTLIEETGWPSSELRSISVSQKGSTSKISGELDPVNYPEDDLFGYMRAEKEQGRRTAAEQIKDIEEEDEEESSKKAPKAKALVRASPFAASLLISIRKKGWLGRDEGFVHLKEGTPLPYTTEFYTTHLQGIFCLAHHRVGRFENSGDRVEFDESKISGYVTGNKLIKIKDSFAYEVADATKVRKERSGELLKALAVLRGGAKQAAFGTDVSPKALVLAGLSCGNPILNHLFEETAAEGLRLNADLFLEVIKDYADRIVTPVFIGVRANYLTNQKQLEELKGTHEFARGKVEIRVVTPREAADGMSDCL